ncbi:5-oxoprolinase subunit PxpB [Rhodoblastus sp. 17X3]|uniref:5-oxoprolinase subunit PxpB n=1 Tax=Rhodoblastus sp. 17X3 TaxID=3047026 RepID=UPI0024B6FA9F|nr:5-oxoprolinase subunit PxpB [Rhodoblastus sp. 17X3]MDI9849619.1 5-oxoprolinase subunit PxpB [Rhodoblastus sp. 17X3]
MPQPAPFSPRAAARVLARVSPRVLALGDCAATISFGESIAPDIHARVKAFCGALAEAGPIPGLKEWAPAFASVTLWYDPDRIAFAELAGRLADLAEQPARGGGTGALFEIPFCAEDNLAPDLDEVAALKGLKREVYLARFGGLVFEVYMLGFQPGFAYLGGLPDALSAPRLATPRKVVPAGSVAIADGMCAAYPYASPGGWRLIGRTPAPLFDIGNAARPALLAPGDRVRWRAISRREFDALESRWRAEGFQPDSLRAAS